MTWLCRNPGSSLCKAPWTRPCGSRENNQKRTAFHSPTLFYWSLYSCNLAARTDELAWVMCSYAATPPLLSLQEPGPAKMAVTSSTGGGSGGSSSSIPSAEKVPTTKSTLWQEEMRAKDQPDGNSLNPAQSPSQSLPPAACTPREPGPESKEGEQ